MHGLIDRGQLAGGETLLVLGAAGGIGLSVIEIGKDMGAIVVAAVSNDEKAAAARDAGADRTIVYGRGPFDKDASKALAQVFKEAVRPTGAHVIYDPVGGDYAEPALRRITWEGRHLVVGFPAGIPKLPLNLALLKSCDIRGVFWGAFVTRNPKRNREHKHRDAAGVVERRADPAAYRSTIYASRGRQGYLPPGQQVRDRQGRRQSGG